MVLKSVLSHCFKNQFNLSWFAAVFLLAAVVMTTGCSSNERKRDYLKAHSTDLTLPKSKGERTNKQACSSPYKVVWGDTLSGIALKCRVSQSALASANGIGAPYAIRVGQKLVIPTGSGRVLARQTKKTSTHTLPSSAEIRQSYKKVNWQWPMQQKLDYRFIRDSAGITGLQINSFPGMPVLAVADGEVVYAGSAIMQFGEMVMLKHPSGHISVYAHNSTIKVKEGQQVKAGQQIASTGETGLTNRPKLYVEARYRGKKVDIKKLLQ